MKIDFIKMLRSHQTLNDSSYRLRFISRSHGNFDVVCRGLDNDPFKFQALVRDNGDAGFNITVPKPIGMKYEYTIDNHLTALLGSGIPHILVDFVGRGVKISSVRLSICDLKQFIGSMDAAIGLRYNILNYLAGADFMCELMHDRHGNHPSNDDNERASRRLDRVFAKDYGNSAVSLPASKAVPSSSSEPAVASFSSFDVKKFLASSGLKAGPTLHAPQSSSSSSDSKELERIGLDIKDKSESVSGDSNVSASPKFFEDYKKRKRQSKNK